MHLKLPLLDRRWLATIVLPILTCFSQTAMAECVKTMRWNDDRPFTFIDKSSSEVKGISADIAREAFKRLDCHINFKKLPWARALEELKLGRIDLISGAYRKPEREVYALFSTQGLLSPNVLFLRADNLGKWQFNELAEMPSKGFRLGTQINVSYSEEYDRLKQNAQFAKILYPQSNRVSLWRMLKMNRIDGVIADTITGRQELNDLNMSGQIKASDFIVSNAPSYFAFSKATTQQSFVQSFDNVLIEMKAEGLFDKIKNHYLD